MTAEIPDSTIRAMHADVSGAVEALQEARVHDAEEIVVALEAQLRAVRDDCEVDNWYCPTCEVHRPIDGEAGFQCDSATRCVEPGGGCGFWVCGECHTPLAEGPTRGDRVEHE